MRSRGSDLVRGDDPEEGSSEVESGTAMDSE